MQKVNYSAEAIRTILELEWTKLHITFQDGNDESTHLDMTKSRLKNIRIPKLSVLYCTTTVRKRTKVDYTTRILVMSHITLYNAEGSYNASKTQILYKEQK